MEEKPAADNAQSTQLPAPSIEQVFHIYAAQAFASLGVMPNPATGETESDMPAARYAIDMLEELQKKTKGNLAPNEADLLENILSQCRMTFVELNKKGS